MTRLWLVRHGEPAALYGDHPDPGLSEGGRAQAGAMADALDGVGPLPLVTSPKRRTRETVAVIEERWGVPARVEPAVGELRAPEGLARDEHRDWLRAFLAGNWAEADEGLRAWRASVVGALRRLPRDTVVVTHYIAINAAVGEATGDDRVRCFRPGYCSVTVLDLAEHGLRLVELGGEAVSVVH